MSYSFPSFLDLNLALPTQTWGQGVAPVWTTSDITIGVARSLVIPRDVRILGTRDDNRLVSDVMVLSVQSAASIASVGHHLIVKSPKVQEENEKLSKMVDSYSKGMQK
ncbi:unnamed protein product [Prunus brigantina]